MLIKVLLTLVLSIFSGILGRMGGAHGFDTLYRDVGCALLAVIAFCLWFGFKINYWYLYLIAFGLHWATFSTYYDVIFGYDNQWFGGLMAGLALFPLLFVYKIIPFYLVRAILLIVIWGLLNKYLPQRIFCWGRDVVEEFMRYCSVIITYLVLIFWR